jgi:hypothetical protein
MVCVRDDKNKIVSRADLVPCATEAEICDSLGLLFREPWDRGMFDPKTQILRPLGPAKYGKWSANWRGRASPRGTNTTATASAEKGAVGAAAGASSPGMPATGKLEASSMLGKRSYSPTTEMV